MRDDVTGDLEEVFHRDCREAGALHARARYWGKVAVFLTAVGLAAAAIPARRGLNIQPIEALRDS